MCVCVCVNLCAILSSLACPALNIIAYYLINGANFEKKSLLSIKYVCLFSLQLLSETFRMLRRIQRDMVINVHWSSCKVLVILVGF